MNSFTKHLLVVLFFTFYFAVKLFFYSYVQDSSDFVSFLNVGTGDSILIKSRGEFMLIDGGPSSYSTNKIYKYTFISKPSVFLPTHYHSDHISGLIKVMRDTPNYDVFSSVQDHTTYQAKILKNIVTKHGYNSVNMGDEYIFNNFKLTVLSPDTSCNSTNLNACSVALLLHHTNGKKVLLLSDSEKESQDSYLHLLDDVDYIKVPHQGSDDSLNKELLSIAKPEYAIISVGKNSYGHPKHSVVDYYQKQGIKILRTDEEGDVVVYFK